mmetsp:Transcript_51488/g.149575  ORF Transcript_51488/g.149575 Transcript_51488/m.149575 type:complete len:415 (+) Transcript_51488:58-1302(+)
MFSCCCKQEEKGHEVLLQDLKREDEERAPEAPARAPEAPAKVVDEGKKEEEELQSLPPDERAKSILRCGAVRLLSATWLMKQGEAFVIRRMQDLPEEAFIRPEQAAEMFNVKWAVIVISYGWLSRKHPDPAGFHMRNVQKYLQKHKEQVTWMSEFGLFWDFASLPQDGPDGKTEHEKKMFKKGLGAINLLYGASFTIVIQLTSMPTSLPLPKGEVNLTPYYSRGWCFFEATVSAIIKDSFYLLDLGLAADHLNNKGSTWHVLNKTAICNRQTPLIPSEMADELQQRKFTNGADVELVTNKYEQFFQEVAATTTELWLNNNSKGKGWNDEKALKLSRALPAFAGLQVLALGAHHAMREPGLAAIRAQLPQLKALKKLILPKHLGDTGTGKALKAEWLKAGKKMAKDQKSEEGLLF